MLLLYGVDLTNCLLVVRKPPKAEPDEIKKFIQNEMMTKFHEYLTTSGKENDVATKIVNGVLTLNKLLDRMNTFYNNFYLIDTPTMLATYKSKLLASLPKLTAFNEKQIATAKKYLDLYTSFYKNEKTCKKEKCILYIKPNGEEVLYK